jgi:hypothetical protein
VRHDGGEGEGGDPLEGGKAIAFPALVRPPGVPLPPPIAAATHITIYKRTDDFSILNEASQLAQEAAAVVEAAAAEAEREAHALNLLMTKNSEPKEERKSIMSVAREALGTPKKEMSLFEKKKVKERLMARKRDTLRVEKEKQEREARFHAERKQAMKSCFRGTVKHAVESQHDDLLRILSHCEEMAPLPLTASSFIPQPTQPRRKIKQQQQQQQQPQPQRRSSVAAKAASQLASPSQTTLPSLIPLK